MDKDEIMEGTIKLNSSHSMVMGHKPKKIHNEDIISKNKEEPGNIIEQFGLFENASPNYTTYYPDVNKEDLNPEDKDFINPVFRMLSEVIVYKGVPIDFSKKGVLKKSMRMLVGQTINIDHEVAVGNAIGAISQVFWQPGYTSKDGVEVPAGINAVLTIDGKSNPRIARGIMMKPPSIHSNSVTVNFQWKPSHSFKENSEFYDRIGTYDEDGELIRLMVVGINNYSETSLVSHGADIYAQKIGDDGEIVNPSYSESVKKFAADREVNGSFNFDYKRNGTKSLKLDSSIPKKTNNINTGGTKNNKRKKSKMDKFKDLAENLNSEFDFGKEELTEENFTELITKKLKDGKQEIENLTEEKRVLKEDLTNKDEKIEEKETKIENLEDEISSFEKDKEHLKKLTSKTQKEAIRLYKLSKGEDCEENIINLISGSDLDMAKSFLNQYKKEVEKEYPASCGKCGSTNITRASAETGKEGTLDDGKKREEGNGEDGSFSEKDDYDTLESVSVKKRRKSLLYQRKNKKAD